MGSALGRQRGQANNVWFASLAWQKSEHEDMHSLAFSLISVFKHSSRALLTFSGAGHTGTACLLGCSFSSRYCLACQVCTFPWGVLYILVLEAFLHDSAFATAGASRVPQWCQVSGLGSTILEVGEV